MPDFGKCRSCGRQILWIKTRAGRNMPVDPTFVNYVEVEGGRERIVTPDGKVISGETGMSPAEADGTGYISHFASCPAADSFRRKKTASG